MLIKSVNRIAAFLQSETKNADLSVCSVMYTTLKCSLLKMCAVMTHWMFDEVNLGNALKTYDQCVPKWHIVLLPIIFILLKSVGFMRILPGTIIAFRNGWLAAELSMESYRGVTRGGSSVVLQA